MSLAVTGDVPFGGHFFLQKRPPHRTGAKKYSLESWGMHKMEGETNEKKTDITLIKKHKIFE